MTINITGRKTTIKDSFREEAEREMTRFDRLFDDDASAHITVSNEGGRETVEITIRSGGMIFRAEKTTEDRKQSLAQAGDLLFRQIVKNKSIWLTASRSARRRSMPSLRQRSRITA